MECNDAFVGKVLCGGVMCEYRSGRSMTTTTMNEQTYRYGFGSGNRGGREDTAEEHRGCGCGCSVSEDVMAFHVDVVYFDLSRIEWELRAEDLEAYWRRSGLFPYILPFLTSRKFLAAVFVSESDVVRICSS